MGHYASLYQGRKVPTRAPQAAPQPIGVSMIDFYKSLGQLPGMDASTMHFTESERAQAREIRGLMAEGRWTVGNIVPHRLAPLVYEGGCPESSPEMMASTHGSIVGRLAAKIDGDVRASLATDPVHDRRGLATDQPPRPRGDLAPHNAELRGNMSHKLRQVMGDQMGTLPEDLFDSEMIRCGISDISERISLKTEAMALGLMRPRGSQQAQRSQRAMTYAPGLLSMTYTPGLMATPPAEEEEPDPGETTLVIKGKLAPEMLERMRQMLSPKKTKPVKTPDGKGLTLRASASDGTCAYDGTGIEAIG